MPLLASPDAPPIPTAQVATNRVGAWATRAVDDPARGRRRDRWFTGVVAAITMVVYLRSLLPGVGYSGDVAKWQYMSVTGGVPHATGEPLWVFLIQVWHHLVPFGSTAWRVNLLAAVFGVGAVTVLFRLLRVLEVRRSVAAATALAFALSPTFWTQASVGEVYTLHILFMASITLCLARWRLGAGNRWLLAGMALLALSFGHHLMTVLALPGVAWLLWSDRRRALTLRNVLWVGLFFALGAAQYLYLLYMSRVGGYVEVPLHSLGDLIDLVRGGEFKNDMWSFGVQEYLEKRVPLLGEVVGAEYLLLQAPIAYGIWRGVRADRPHRDISIHLFSLGLLSTIFATNYRVFDVQVFFLPLLFVLAVFLGLGLEGMIAWAHQNYPGHERMAWGVVAALAAVPLLSGVVDYRRSSQHGNVEDAQRIERAIRVAGHDAVLLTDDYPDTEYILYYFHIDGVDRARNLATVGRHGVTVNQVKLYLLLGVGPVAQAAHQVEGVRHPALYTPVKAQAVALKDAGVKVRKVAKDVWRVEDPSA